MNGNPLALATAAGALTKSERNVYVANLHRLNLAALREVWLEQSRQLRAATNDVEQMTCSARLAIIEELAAITTGRIVRRIRTCDARQLVVA